jgi:hypothetical protein
VAGERDGALLVRVKAPPVEGQANDALIRLLSRTLKVPASRLALQHGTTGRQKLVRVQGLGRADLLARLGLS